MLVGYARVSTFEQNLTPQVDALQQAGCEKIFKDRASGVKTDRPGLREALKYVRKGDTLLVWRLDRLGRSLIHLIEIVNQLEEHRGLAFAVCRKPLTLLQVVASWGSILKVV
jgi:DNA invertase Pin-like site-specific DNA recombinase